MVPNKTGLVSEDVKQKQIDAENNMFLSRALVKWVNCSSVSRKNIIVPIERLKCKVCKKTFAHLGSHLWHKHKMLARDYKEMYGLPYKMGLVSEVVRQKQINAENKWKGHKNFKKCGKKYQFKKGCTGQRRISDYERRRYLKRMIAINKQHKILKPCPVCRMQYNHVESHLYQVHKLVSIERLLRAGLMK